LIDPRTIIAVLALTVSLATLLVAGRFLWCLVDALRMRRYLIAAVSAAGMAVIFLLLAAVVTVWFGYAVAHTGKSMRTDLIVLFSTVPPFLLASIGLWLVGGKLYRHLHLADNKKAKTLPPRHETEGEGKADQ
jgi:hypothetical protein